MTNDELENLIRSGENIHTEFKQCTKNITNDLYDTVCSFSNRDGGIIILGVKDDGEIIGIDTDAQEKIIKDFVTAINTQKISPSLYLVPQKYTINTKDLFVIEVPACSVVCRHNGRIFDRNHESDIDITDNADMVYQLYARKSTTYFVNKVTHFTLDDLRSDLIDRARIMANARTAAHPWKLLSNEELLRSAGLILKDSENGFEGVTTAAILLFGKDSTIMSILPRHKTDAILRVKNLDRYDDRDVISTNLLESYDRLMAFGQKHLNDTFIMEGIQSVSARDHILREIFSNSLAHRDYSSPYIAKFVIEADKLYTENANRCNGYGLLKISSFQPFAKNPPISKVFREIGLADELGSGMRNTFKYSHLYSGELPEFFEGNIFKTTIPLNSTDIAATKAKPSMLGKNHSQSWQNITDNTCDKTYDETHDRSHDKTYDETHDRTHDRTHDEIQVKILNFCITPHTKSEIAQYCGYKNTKSFTQKYLRPLLDGQKLQMTLPDKPKSKNQQYVTKAEVIGVIKDL